jgi:hypothetical protein
MSDADLTNDTTTDTTEAEASIPVSLIEELARGQGWKETGKLDAADFLKSVPDYRRNLVNKLDRLEQRQRELADENARLHTFMAEQAMRAHKTEVSTLEQQLRQAATTGDVDAVARIADEMRKATPPTPAPAPNNAAGWDAWKATPLGATIWADQAMRDDAIAFANAEAAKLGRDDPATIAPIIEAKVRKLHSQRFANPNRGQAAAAEAGSGNGRPPPSAKRTGFTDLPPEMQAMYRQLMAQDPRFTEEAIVARYNNLPAHMRNG